MYQYEMAILYCTIGRSEILGFKALAAPRLNFVVRLNRSTPINVTCYRLLYRSITFTLRITYSYSTCIIMKHCSFDDVSLIGGIGSRLKIDSRAF